MTPKEAAQAVLNGETVLATNHMFRYLIKSDRGFIFAYKKEDSRQIIGCDFFDFKPYYEYSIYKPEEEKRYRWLVKHDDENLIYKTDFYLNKEEVIKEKGVKVVARLDCLDDLKEKEYYTEEF